VGGGGRICNLDYVLSLSFCPTPLNFIGQKNNGGVVFRIKPFLITIFVPPLQSSVFIPPPLFLEGWGGGSLSSYPPGGCMVVILSSQINSACVTHCIVRCKGVTFCPLFRAFYILWLPFLQGLYSVSYPLFRETSTLSLCIWVRLMV
jgi:hypothetical protein